MVGAVSARQFLLLVWRYRRLLAVSVVVCLSAAVVLALTKEPVYEASTQFFVSTSGTGRDVGAAYRGELFSQQRVASYAEMVSSTRLLRAVARQVPRSGGTQELQGRIRASVIPDTALIDVTAAAESPEQAKAIADAVGGQLPRFVDALERPGDSSVSPVRLSVTREAELPGSASSPGLPLYVILGLVTGLGLGMGAIALAAAFDRRVRSIEEIERIAGTPVIGIVAEDGDERGPLVLLDEPLSGRAEDYRRIRTQLLARWPRSAISSLVVRGVGGRDGRTSIAANLGLALAHGGQRVVLVDGDSRAASLSGLFGVRSHVGLSDLLMGDAAPDEVLLRSLEPRLAIVASGTPQADPSDLLASPRLPAVIAVLREHADVVIIDGPSLEDAAVASTLAPAASALLLVTRLDSTTAAQLESAAQAIGVAPERVFGVVVNRRPPRRWRRRTTSRAAARLLAAQTPPGEAGADVAAHGHSASGSRA
jgi:succinoglycan biosynthesis transport protein ExoP